MNGIHPRISVSGLGFDKETPLADDLERVAAAGFERVGLHRDKLAAAGWEAGCRLAAAAPPQVVYLVHRAMFDLAEPDHWEEQAAAVVRTVDAAASLGASLVYATTGSAIGLSWGRAIAALDEALAPVRDRCREREVRLALETAPTQFADINFLHTLRDAVDAAAALGVGVCFDTCTCWTERDLRPTIDRGREAIALVQVNDYVPGDRGLAWAVPGDGAIPIERIVAALLETGYEGHFDLKVRARPPESQPEALRRGAARLGSILEKLGA